VLETSGVPFFDANGRLAGYRGIDRNITGGRGVRQTRLLPNNMIEVTVTDSGPGINTIMAGKIFDQFQTSKETGMGIGLSLSRTIIEVHGGKLWVDKDYQNGALFGFELRVSK